MRRRNVTIGAAAGLAASLLAGCDVMGQESAEPPPPTVTVTVPAAPGTPEPTQVPLPTSSPASSATAEPEDYEEAIDVARTSVGEFWQRDFSLLGTSAAYEGPSAVNRYSGSRYEMPDIACRMDPDTARNNAFFCGADESISYDDDFLRRLYDESGVSAPTMVFAHEWGHLVQHLAGAPERSIQKELMADCFAGSYAQYAVERGILAEGDVVPAARTFFAMGDDEFSSAPWFADGVHGTSTQRVNAFMTGFLAESMDPCQDYQEYGADNAQDLGDGARILLPDGLDQRPYGGVRVEARDGSGTASYTPVEIGDQDVEEALEGVAKELLPGEVTWQEEVASFQGDDTHGRWYRQVYGGQDIYGVFVLTRLDDDTALKVDSWAGGPPTSAEDWFATKRFAEVLLAGVERPGE